MIGLGSELLIKTGLIMKKMVMRKNMFCRKAMVSRRFDKKPEKKSAMPKEQRARRGSGI